MKNSTKACVFEGMFNVAVAVFPLVLVVCIAKALIGTGVL